MSTRLLLPLALALLVGCGGKKPPEPEPPAPQQNRAPSASITSPQDGATLSSRTITLQAQASDPEDGALTGAALKWTSSVDGALGTGSPLEVTLTPGNHRLTLVATDSGGKTANAQLSITVLAPVNLAPVAVIDTPGPNGTSLHEGDTLVLQGHATDPEQGNLSGASLTWTSDKGGVLGTGTAVSFHATVVGEHRIVLTATDSQGLTAQASTTLNVLLPGANLPPTVTLSQPADGTQVRVGTALTLEGSAADPEDGALMGDSLVWTSSIAGKLGTGPRLTNVQLALGTHTVTLTATDSHGTTASASVFVTVTSPTNTAPTVSITAPPDGTTVFAGTSITFTGKAIDAEDGTLPGAALTWLSNLNGVLGTGNSLTVSKLVAGTHDIRLTATDSQATSVNARLRVVVLPANEPPTVRIDSPAGGSHFGLGATVALRGAASDPEDGPLSGNSLTWQSNVSGVLGRGASLDIASLSVGLHTLTLVATDSGGRTAATSIAITIDPASAKVPPVARLTGPTQGEARQVLTFDGATSSDPDGTVARYRFDFGDGQPVMDGTAAQASHTFASAGTYTVTLTVTDNDGMTASTPLTLTVSAYMHRPVVLAEGRERYGISCRLAMRGAVAHLAYLSTLHNALWYATVTNGVFAAELVEGLGLGTGGIPGDHIALAVASDGTPHLAYTRVGQGVWYATKTASGWLHERVDTATTASWDNEVSLALDPAQSDRPTLVWTAAQTGSSGSVARVAIATRGSAGVWSTAVQNFSVTSTNQLLRGDAVFDSSGRLYLPLADNTLGRWKGTTVETLTVASWSTSGWASLASRASGLLVLSHSGVQAVTVASPYPTSTVSTSSIEDYTLTTYAVAADASGAPRLAFSHDGQLEVARPGAGNYWERAYLGAVDASRIGAGVDSNDETRACFFRDQRLMLY
ncbi:PKD domain-containing protein [Myxococcaceae bacterium JPH2]|nr:PKD domain-containing protein [Myxococcaceae bacterium JPH2]